MHKDEAPEIEFVTRDEIDLSDEAYVELAPVEDSLPFSEKLSSSENCHRLVRRRNY